MAIDLIDDRFHLEHEAGRGGMGIVYRAHDRATGRAVAVKLLEGYGSPERFVREAAVLAELEHPGIVGYVAHGALPDGVRWLAMEWLDGETLESLLGRRALAPVEALVIARRAAEALAAAHRHGVVHRDVKPSNLFLVGGEVERLKLLDFGVARVAGDRGGTMTGAVIGTIGYMAPEQARGAPELDARADVFALGCVLYECLGGRPAFPGDQPVAVLSKILFDDPPALAGLPAPLSALLARMLAKDADERPRDGTAVGAALDALGGAIDALGRTIQGPAPVPHDPGLGGATVLPDGAIGRSEQRVVCLLLVGAPAAGDAVRAAATPFGARVERLANGAFVLLFPGVALAADQAMRAGRAALAIRALVAQAPLALVAGRAVVTGRLPLGEVIDRGAAVLARTPPGTVGLDEVMVTLLEPRFVVEERELVGERAGDAPRRVCGRATSFVGRERELVTLEQFYDECATDSVARAVLVVAPAGGGKTRVRQELLGRIAARRPAPTILFAGADVIAAGAPFGLAGAAVRRAAGLPAKLGARAAAFLAAIAGLPIGEADAAVQAALHDPTLMAEGARSAWVDWLRAETAVAPVVLVLEDLHWGDLPSVKLVDAALAGLSDRPLLVLALARPDVHDVFPGLWKQRELHELRLGALSPRAAARLVAEIVGDAAGAATVAEIARRADGNPFFLEELARAVRTGGLALPESVLGTVQARLDALGEDAKRVLRAASVFGQSFWPGGVQALAGGRVEIWLDELVAREVIEPSGSSAVAGETELVFRHALLREAAYAMLPEDARRQAHARAGDWLEARGAGEPLALATHFELGGDRRAARWFQRAAAQALEGNDLDAAMARAERAVGLGAAGETLGALRLVQAEAHGWRSEHELAEPRAREALALLPRGGDLWASAARHAAWAARVLARGEDLAALADELKAVFASAPTAPLMISLCATAVNLIEAGLYPQAGALLDEVEASSLARDEGPPLSRAWLAHAQVFRASLDANPDEMLRALRGSVEQWEAAGDQRNALLARINVGVACLELGVQAEAERELRAVVAAAERMGVATAVNYARMNHGWALGARGSYDEARRVERLAAEAFRARGDAGYEGIARTYLALIELRAGSLEAAQRENANALALLGGNPSWRAFALAAGAHIAASAGAAPADSMAPAAEAMEILRSLGGLQEGEAFVRLVHAECAWAAGDRVCAAAAIRAASDRLAERAARIRDPAARKSFLEGVAENARTLELARAWLDE